LDPVLKRPAFFSMDSGKASSGARRATRTRKVAASLAVVDDDARQRARHARLNALEDDAHVLDDVDDDPDDDEFVLDTSDEADTSDDEETPGAAAGAGAAGDGSTAAGKKRKKKRPAKRTKAARTSRHRSSLSGAPSKLKTLQEWIEQDGLEEYPEYEPTYLTATVGAATTRSARTFCSVCGQAGRYTCVRCGTRYCCMKCSVIHTETRCLKFTA
jgi:zinc finger HIT domain-containing protein 1